MEIKRIRRFLAGCLLLLLLFLALQVALYWNLLPAKSYTAEELGLETLRSPVDYNKNGVDDYTDFLLGARKDAENHPRYDGRYVAGGYPQDGAGVCTDVIWRAFRQAGYSLKDMVSADILQSPESYRRVDTPDPDIDFRRVPNLKVFFERHAVPLTTDPADTGAWQPGDIVTYGERHIAIVSDKRTRAGKVWIIHNGGQPRREEPALTRNEISGHFRFDASLLPEEALFPWAE